MHLSNLKIQQNNNSSLYVFYMLFILLCIGLMFVWPITIIRTQYFTFADIILNSTKWLHQLDFSNCVCGDGLSDVTTYRSMGYPLIIAFFKSFFGSWHIKAIVIFQIILWCYSSLVFWNFLDEFGFKKFFKWIFVLSYLSGWGFFSQFDLLSDGVYTSVFTILVVNCAKLILHQNIYTKTKLLQCGVLLLVCFLIKEVTLHISVIFFSMFFLFITKNSFSNDLKKLFISSIIFFMPLIIFICMQISWNYYRSDGHFFINLAARTALGAPIELAIISDQRVLDNSVLFDEEAKNFIRKEIKSLSINKMKVGQFYLTYNAKDIQKRYSLTEFELTNLVKKEYFRIWKDHPKIMFNIMKEYILANFDLIFLFRPLESLENYYAYYEEYFGQKKKLMHLNDLRKISYKEWQKQDVIFVLFVNLFRLFSVLISLVCAFKIIVIFLRYLSFNNTLSVKDKVNLFLILIYSGYILIYSTVHIELRYLAAVFSLPAFVGLYGLQHILNKIKQYFHKASIINTKERITEYA